MLLKRRRLLEPHLTNLQDQMMAQLSYMVDQLKVILTIAYHSFMLARKFL